MPTLRQKLVAKKVAEKIQNSEPIVMKEILAETGYSPGMQKNPEQILSSEGVQQELQKRGISLEDADTEVGVILKAGENMEKLKAADLVYKRLGGYAPDKSINLNVDLTINDEAIDKLADILAIHERTNQPGDGIAADPVDKEVRNQD